MIKANELRIGNWVEVYAVVISGSWYDADGNRHGQDKITEPTINRKQIGVGDLNVILSSQAGLATYRPIPLTPEILEKCGFDWSIYYQAFHKEYFEFDITECYPKGYALTTFKRGLIIAPNIQYLHQLQNLYYSLTGEELEIKEFYNFTTY